MLDSARRFELTVLPLLDSGYNLARWLLQDSTTAEDVVQESVMRALKYFDKLRGDDARSWFLGIVRNVCFTQMKARSLWVESPGHDDDELEALQFSVGLSGAEPDDALQQGQEHALVNAALRALPASMREVLVLRELEGMDYAQIAKVTGMPLGTVMSRLSRARTRMKALLTFSGLRR